MPTFPAFAFSDKRFEKNFSLKNILKVSTVHQSALSIYSFHSNWFSDFVALSILLHDNLPMAKIPCSNSKDLTFSIAKFYIICHLLSEKPIKFAHFHTNQNFILLETFFCLSAASSMPVPSGSTPQNDLKQDEIYVTEI